MPTMAASPAQTAALPRWPTSATYTRGGGAPLPCPGSSRDDHARTLALLPRLRPPPSRLNLNLHLRHPPGLYHPPPRLELRRGPPLLPRPLLEGTKALRRRPDQVLPPPRSAQPRMVITLPSSITWSSFSISLKSPSGPSTRTPGPCMSAQRSPIPTFCCGASLVPRQSRQPLSHRQARPAAPLPRT